MRVLITGASGFIGSHLVEHLLVNTDWDIVGLDSLSYAGDVNRLTDSEFFDTQRVKILWHDLRAPVNEHLASRIGEIDYIVNMASESHVDRSLADPVPFVHNNVMLALHMLEFARQVKPLVFLQVSTDEVYGPAPGRSHKEWATVAPSNPYAASKASQEAVAFGYWRSYGVPVVITSTMNNFGERQDREKLIPLTIRKLLAKDPVPVHSREVGSKWESGARMWLHARNHADAILYILTKLSPAAYPEVTKPDRYNVVGDREITNLQIVEKVAEILGVEALYEHVDAHSSRPGHDLRYALDGSKLKGLGWVPPVDFEDSFKRTVIWYADVLERNKDEPAEI